MALNPYQSPVELDEPTADKSADADGNAVVEQATGLVRLSDIIVTSTGWITVGAVLVGVPVFVALASKPGMIPIAQHQTVLGLAVLTGAIAGAGVAGGRLFNPP